MYPKPQGLLDHIYLQDLLYEGPFSKYKCGIALIDAT